jgi:hypothetical protein
MLCDLDFCLQMYISESLLVSNIFIFCKLQLVILTFNITGHIMSVMLHTCLVA